MANRTTPAAQTATQLVDCFKCDGKGRISGFGHIVGGRCFECGGSGKIAIDAITESEAFKLVVANLYASAQYAMDCAADGYDTHAVASLGKMVCDMFRIGTDKAREILRFISAGKFWSTAGNRWRRLDRETAHGLTRQLIEMGRDAKAQEAEQNIDSADHERAA
jgi:hypothetical protein